MSGEGSIGSSSHEAARPRVRGASGNKAYALSPMQGGMLFQHLLSDAASDHGGYDVEQIQIEIDEDIEPVLLGDAFSAIVRRHPVLATGFRWEGVERPEQRPFPDLHVPVEIQDFSAASDAGLPQLRADFLRRDRLRSFDLRKPPLMRVTCMKLAASGRSELVWTFHHILLDGRSFASVLVEVFRVYDALRPIVLAQNPGLVLKVDTRFATLEQDLAQYDLGATFAAYDDLLNSQIHQLTSDVNALLGPMGQVADAIQKA